MSINVRPASDFDGVRAVLGPKSPTADVCWCPSHRIPSKPNQELCGPARGEHVAELCRTSPPPGVFERAGFVQAADTTSVLAGHPRILMCLDLRRAAPE